MAFGALKGGAGLTGAANSISNPFSVTGSIAVSVGDLIYAVLGEQVTLTVTACGDNLHGGSTYTATQAGTDAGTSTGRAFYKRVTVPGTLTSVDFVTTGSTDNVAAVVAVFEGPFDSSPLDANPTNITSDITSPFTCPATGTLAQASELVVTWAVATGNTVWAATSPNLLGPQIATQSVLHTLIGYQTVSATTDISPVFTAASNPTDAVLGTSSFKEDLNIQRFQNTQHLSRLVSKRRLFPRHRELSNIGGVDISETARVRSTFFLRRNILRPRRYIRDFSLSTHDTVGSDNLSPPLYVDDDTFYTHAVTPGSVDLAPSLYTDADTFYTHVASSTYALSPSLYVDDDTFYTHAVTPGAVNLSPSLYIDPDTFYTHTITTGAVDLTVALYVDDDTFYTPAITTAYNLTSSLYVDDDTFYTHTITPGAVDLTPSLYVDDDTFYTASIAVGAVDIAPELYVDDDTFYSATVSGAIQPETRAPNPLYRLRPRVRRYNRNFNIFISTIGQDLISGLYVDDDTFYTPTVTSEGGLSPSLYIDGDTFYSATITVGSVDISPGLFIDDNAFYRPAVIQDDSTNYITTLVLGRVQSRRRSLSFSTPISTLSFDQDLTPSVYVNNNTFYCATIPGTDLSIIRGPNALHRLLSRVRNHNRNFSIASSTLTDIGVAPSLYVDVDTFYTPIITGEGSISVSLYIDDDTFYTHTITVGTVNISPSLFINDNTFYRPTVVQDDSSIYTTTLTFGRIQPRRRFLSVSTPISTLSFDQELTPSLYIDDDTFYTATIPSAETSVVRAPNPLHRRLSRIRKYNRNFSIVNSTLVDIAPSLYVDDDAFYTHTITQEGVVNTRNIFLLRRHLPTIRVRNRNFNVFATDIDVDLVPSLYVDDDIFYSPTVTGEGSLSVELYIDDDTFYTHTISVQDVTPRSPFFVRRITHRRSNGRRVSSQLQADTTVNLSPSLFVNNNVFYSATVLNLLFSNCITTLAVGRVRPRRRFLSVSTPLSTVSVEQNLTASLYIDVDTFYSPTVNSTYNLTSSLYIDADTFYVQSVISTYDLQPSLYIDGDTFYTSVITVGSVDLAPLLYTDVDTFYTIVLASGDISISPSLYVDIDTFYTHTITGGLIDIAPSLYSDADVFYTQTVSATYDLLSSLYVDGDTFYAHTITSGSVNLDPPLYNDIDTFYLHVITTGSIDISPSLYIDGDTFYTHAISGGTFNLTSSLYIDDDTFYNHIITTTNELTSNLYIDTDTFYTHTISSTYNLNPSLYVDVDTFYESLFSGGTKELFPSLFENTNTFYQASLAGPQPEVSPVVFGGFGSGPPRRVQKRDARVNGIIFIRKFTIIPGHAVTISFVPGNARVDTVPELKPFINTIKFRLPVIGEGFGDNFSDENLDELLLLISEVLIESDDD